MTFTRLLAFAAALPLAPAAAQPFVDPPVALDAEVVADGFLVPVLVTAPPEDSRLFVVEQPGRISMIENGARAEAPFLDLMGQVAFGGEQGLLGLAFHPDYAQNGRFFVNFTDRSGDTRIVEFRVSDDPARADPASARVLLAIDQPYANHNGGWIAFGPDGYLYIAMGDGGSGGDPQGNGQNTDTLLGKILRIDVNGGDPYDIPADNPFADGGGAPEIFAFGLRNPWRDAFDGNRLIVADVGQGDYEEVSIVDLDAPGANLGWNVMEGAHCYRANTCDMSGLVLPVYEYPHVAGACSITGGHVYRGSAIPELTGQYFFGDYCAGFVRSFGVDGGETHVIDWSDEIGGVGSITSFGQDAAGEIYITAVDGRVFKLVPG